MVDNILRAQSLNKSYKMNKKVRLDVLKDVSLKIEASKYLSSLELPEPAKVRCFIFWVLWIA